ncbi:MAG: TOMM precursor leader peptide-binding protein [Candidatus Parabeggiatoa sp.]|nr:TOMM precursor leader peptide-binding protein [Candidatus Parabeggiatoa sp.]
MPLKCRVGRAERNPPVGARKPQFKPSFRCEIIPFESVFLLSEQGHFRLSGQVYTLLAPLLNGQYTEQEIVERLKKQIPIATIFYALEVLRREGYVVDAVPPMRSELAAYWDMLEIEPAAAAKRLKDTTVSLISFGKIDITPFKEMLESLGVNVVDEGDCWIILTDDYLQGGLEAINREALSHQRSWLLVKPVGTELWLGPLFRPNQTGCWACLAQRLRGHRKVESYLEDKLEAKTIAAGAFTPPMSCLPSTLQTAFAMAATEVVKWIVCGENPHLEGKVITLNTLSLEKRDHILVHRPQCPSCGNPTAFTASQSIPLRLQTQPKSFIKDGGGHRILFPEDTFKKLAHHLSPITGIVSRLERNTVEGDEKGPVSCYIADHNFARAEDELYFLRQGLRSISSGKGKLDIQAKTGALCESIERYSGVFQGDEARIRAKLKDLGTAAIHPNACMLFSERQFNHREQWNAKNSRFNWVPEPFDDQLEIEWSPVWSLTDNEPRYIPTAYCYYGYARKHHVQFARADANGCAAGNTQEEAILQGFMELVERDSVAIWWYNRLKRPVVDLLSFEEPYFQTLIAYYKKHHRALWVLDITSDLNIPVFAALSRRNDQAREDILLGFGAHFDPQIALLRAITELNQFFPTMVAAKTPDNLNEPEIIDWLTTATLGNQPYLSPDEAVPPKTLSDYPEYSSNDIEIDIRHCLQIVQAKGLEMLILDQTRPDIGLPVVKVIVPGLRHFWGRFGPGRLYDVPVQMGNLTQALTEPELNPKLMFI